MDEYQHCDVLHCASPVSGYKVCHRIPGYHYIDAVYDVVYSWLTFSKKKIPDLQVHV